jgi:EmrB/QacA subfamily drug resistance transporter
MVSREEATEGLRGASGAVVLALLCAASFMAVLDTTIVSIALPSMRRGLGFTTASVQWVLNAYALAFGGLLLLAGRLADGFGRRRVFMIGLGVFGLTSIAGGSAVEPWMLVVARFCQGAGAAALAPTSLALITTSFAKGRSLNRALAAYSSMAGLGFVTGMLLGGILTEYLTWRWVLFVNAPIALAVLLGTAAVVRDDEPRSRGTADVPGALLVTCGIGALLYGLSEGQETGWTSRPTVWLTILGVSSLGAWIVVESRSPAPLVPLSILRSRSVGAANVIVMLTSTIGVAQLFILTLYFQDVLDHSPIETGLRFVPMTVASVAAAVLSGRMVTRLGAKTTTITGLVLLVSGGLLMMQLSVEGLSPELLTGMVIAESGFMMAAVPMNLSATSGVGEERRGLAGGLVNTSGQLGNAWGLGVIATVVAARASALGAETTATEALVSGFRYGIAAGLLFVSLALVVAVFWLRPTSA